MKSKEGSVDPEGNSQAPEGENTVSSGDKLAQSGDLEGNEIKIEDVSVPDGVEEIEGSDIYQGPSSADLHKAEVREFTLERLSSIMPIAVNMREWVITRLENHYYLAINPESVFKEQCILLRGDKIDWSIPLSVQNKHLDVGTVNAVQENAQSRAPTNTLTNTSAKPMIHFDFSQTTKLRITEHDIKSIKADEVESQNTKSNLTSRFFDPLTPFSTQDMETIDGLVKEMDAYALYTAAPELEHVCREYTRVREEANEAQDYIQYHQKVLNHKKEIHLENDDPNMQPNLEDITIPTSPYLNYNVHILQRTTLLKHNHEQSHLLEFERLFEDVDGVLVCDADREEKRLFEEAMVLEKLRIIQREEERLSFLAECKLRREQEEANGEGSKVGDIVTGKKALKTVVEKNEDLTKSKDTLVEKVAAEPEQGLLLVGKPEGEADKPEQGLLLVGKPEGEDVKPEQGLLLVGKPEGEAEKPDGEVEKPEVSAGASKEKSNPVVNLDKDINKEATTPVVSEQKAEEEVKVDAAELENKEEETVKIDEALNLDLEAEIDDTNEEDFDKSNQSNFFTICNYLYRITSP